MSKRLTNSQLLSELEAARVEIQKLRAENEALKSRANKPRWAPNPIMVRAKALAKQFNRATKIVGTEIHMKTATRGWIVVPSDYVA